MKLRINPIAERDLTKIREYIAEDNEEMAIKTIKEIFDMLEQIQRFPYIGVDLSKRVSFKTDFRYAICGNYIILYKIKDDCIGIYRIISRYKDVTKLF